MTNTDYDTDYDPADDDYVDDIDSGLIEADPYGDWADDAWMAQFDDDPNPYHGDYSEC